jgi:Xaa-Pro aminopeptidase
MGIAVGRVELTTESLDQIQRHLRGLGIDGWLLYDFRGNNPIAAGVLGLPALSRRVFVLLPAHGSPIAITHRIEQQPWEGWIGENRVYLSWQSLERELKRLLSGAGTVAIEHATADSVPYVDRVPAGVLELVHRAGARTVSSGDLVSAVHSRWSPAGEASHRRAALVLKEAAFGAFARIRQAIASGAAFTELDARNWIVERLRSQGLEVGADAVVAVNANAANPHYSPESNPAPVRPGDVVLIDLWGKEDDAAIYADQTWMGFVGERVPERVEALWRTIRDARDAAVTLIERRWSAGEPVAGFEVDDAARQVIAEGGFADAFLHRTGHSIDRDLHGSGPNLDNLETRDTRRLIPGVGFSVEPGVYFAGEVGLRTEIDVYMSSDGPVVTTPDPQREMHRIVG